MASELIQMTERLQENIVRDILSLCGISQRSKRQIIDVLRVLFVEV